ncbi:hypothetical protein [Methylobacter sp.]|uniref:hypothetical protein n=1 Tax=Methylobacter sp. TaxID=2051955 RepID=UPI00120F3EAE|nr:hypothetical protein [Methylobacter sp.]TAK63903.1 MAG: hypothetical protein EPO18_05355 [Methylobacter sp.]
MKLLPMLEHEIKEIGLVSLYFFFCFGVMLTLKKLFLADYQIEVSVLSKAAISALIVAKIVIVLDATHAGRRFDASFPLGLAALYKTLVYILATFVVLFLEKLIEAYWEIGTLGQAVSDVWEHRDRNLILAKVLCVGLAFFAYHLYAGLDRRLGEGTLRRLVTERPNLPGQTPNPDKEYEGGV